MGSNMSSAFNNNRNGPGVGLSCIQCIITSQAIQVLGPGRRGLGDFELPTVIFMAPAGSFNDFCDECIINGYYEGHYHYHCHYQDNNNNHHHHQQHHHADEDDDGEYDDEYEYDYDEVVDQDSVDDGVVTDEEITGGYEPGLVTLDLLREWTPLYATPREEPMVVEEEQDENAIDGLDLELRLWFN